MAVLSGLVWFMHLRYLKNRRAVSQTNVADRCGLLFSDSHECQKAQT